MKLFPEQADTQLEFDKIKALLFNYCQGEYAKQKAQTLRIHTRLSYVELELKQSHQYRQILTNSINFPGDQVFNLSTEIKLLGIEGAVLAEEQIMNLRRLTEGVYKVFRWFDKEKIVVYDALHTVIEHTYYEPKIIENIDAVIDAYGHVKDSASKDLSEIRLSLFRKRNELKRAFDRLVNKYNRLGYLVEIEESFMNGRRVLAVFAEQKRTIKGILHGESDSRKTSFVEPEETIDLNNEVSELENAERKEVYKILKQLTAKLSAFAALLQGYLTINGEFDFIYAKAKLAGDYGGISPLVYDKSLVQLVDAVHPLLYIYNRKNNKPTIPLSLSLDDGARILLISGPNAGGKTVALKTIGLLQMMVQSGLLVPVHPSSQFGIFKQLMIHIGDTQSLEFELSTYSSHLLHMKYFIENATGHTLLFIDELGSGSDPNLGGAFAEVILLELLKKHSIGVVTTHYLNLKIMAGKTPGIMNGAMAFDEEKLMPLYKLILGRPGSSYTFSIAERIGLQKQLIESARKLVDEGHFKLDKLLNRAEQDMRGIEKMDESLQQLLEENSRLKSEMEAVVRKEKHVQQLEILKEQNRVAEEKYLYLKDMERKLKQMLIDWRRQDDKEKVIKQMDALLFKRETKTAVAKHKKKIDSKFQEVEGDIQIGDKVKIKQNHQIGEVIELREKVAIVKVGLLPIQTDKKNLVLVKERKETTG